ncbi:MAG: response regulator [Okeania sp. SIO3B3]|nr:response regulator [Okeania sp. SIO3B3]
MPSGIEVDDKRLRQILFNLLNNAIKFTEQGQVTFNVSVIGQPSAQTIQLRFQVADTGVGINAAQIDQIFQPFEQVGDVQRRAEGTGLGLAISRRLVVAMGGELHVESEQGHGSLFWFDIELPFVTLDTHFESVVNRRVVGYAGSQHIKVLIIDDKDYNRAVIATMLQVLGFKVIEASNGQQGIERAVQILPEVIITDLIMPVMTGFEVAQHIRRIPELGEKTLIIATSASAFDEDKSKSVLSGCNAFLPKPVNPPDLLNLLQQHLQLEWIYDQPPTVSTPESNEELGAESFPTPPADALRILQQAASTGDMRTVREQAKALGALDTQYQSLARKLETLASSFDDHKILELLESIVEASP